MATGAPVSTTTHRWVFRARLRRAAFGWRGSKLAIARIDEALAEIRAVARHDPAAAGEGAVILLENCLQHCARWTAPRVHLAMPPGPPSRHWCR